MWQESPTSRNLQGLLLSPEARRNVRSSSRCLLDVVSVATPGLMKPLESLEPWSHEVLSLSGCHAESTSPFINQCSWGMSGFKGALCRPLNWHLPPLWPSPSPLELLLSPPLVSACPAVRSAATLGSEVLYTKSPAASCYIISSFFITCERALLEDHAISHHHES